MTDERPSEFLATHPVINVVRDPGRIPPGGPDRHRGHIASSEVSGRDELFDALVPALGLPDWFGRNWDALSDVLRDLSWIEATHVALVVTDAEEMLRAAPRTSAHLFDVWTSAAVAQAERGRALQLFLVVESR